MIRRLLQKSVYYKSSSNKIEKIKNITLDLQKATQEDLVFYNLANNPKAIELFLGRLKDSSAALVCVGFDGDPTGFEFVDSIKCVFVNSKDFLPAQKLVADHFYPINTQRFKLVGVTGTNGKTTTVHLANQIANFLGLRSISIGTLGVISEKLIKLQKGVWSTPTTPSYLDLRKIIFEYEDEVDVIFIEVSSHALEQKRLYNLKLDVAAWTNLTQDHLNYHKTMESYFVEKLKIYTELLSEDGNLYLPSGETNLTEKIVNKLQLEKGDISKVKNACPVTAKTSGVFNVDFNKANLELALEINREIVGEDIISKIDFDKLELPDGRFNLFEFNNKTVVVDYAHTPDALENILSALKRNFSHKKIITIFGCGGDRDRSKRPEMAKIVSKISDSSIITSDNTRTEVPSQILDDIEKGMDANSKYTVIEDRRDAIAQSLEALRDDELLLIAGRGPEEYWHYNGEKIEFSDLITVKEFVKNV